jgi:hypothetical protein
MTEAPAILVEPDITSTHGSMINPILVDITRGSMVES